MSVRSTDAAPRGGHRYQLDSGLEQLTPAEHAERGKEARAAVPCDSHAVFDPPPDRANPVGLLEEQAKTRVPELVPVRWGRMMVSPFTYYRGAALPMATDLAATVFDQAVTQFAAAYVDQNERDHQSFVDAIASGRITAEPGM